MGRVSPDYYVQDGVIPRTRLPEVLRRIARARRRAGLRVATCSTPATATCTRWCSTTGPGRPVRGGRGWPRAIVELCVEQGGSITGEHGVGTDKVCSMPAMFSDDDLTVMAGCAPRWIRPACAIPASCCRRRGCAGSGPGVAAAPAGGRPARSSGCESRDRGKAGRAAGRRDLLRAGSGSRADPRQRHQAGLGRPGERPGELVLDTPGLDRMMARSPATSTVAAGRHAAGHGCRSSRRAPSAADIGPAAQDAGATVGGMVATASPGPLAAATARRATW